MNQQAKVKSPNREELRTLILSIGGAEKLSAILKSFYETMSKDILIGFFFQDKDIERIASKQGEFMLLAAGLLQVEFQGKGPNTAHEKLAPILEGHFDRRLLLLRQCLVTEGLTENQISFWLQFEESFRAMVVTSN